MIGTVVFDLDGTLVQTELLKGLSYARAAMDLKPGAVTEGAVMNAYRSVVGRAREEVIGAMMERFGLSDAHVFTELRQKHYEAMLTDGDLLRQHAIAHNIALVRRAREAGLRVALGSMSYRAQIGRVLGYLGLADSFDFVASRDDVSKGKPDPEIYNLILSRLGSSPLQSLAVEDSAAGVGAAVAAGMHCMAVPTDLTRDGLLAAKLLSHHFIAEQPDVIAATFERILAGAHAELGQPA